MSTPLLGRNAVILEDSTEIGYCENVTVGISADLIKKYAMGGSNPDRPSVLESGNKSFSVSIERAYIDNTYATDVLNGTKLTVEVRPEGTGAGNPKITISNVVLNSFEMTIAQDGVILEALSGEGTAIAWGTQ